VRRSVRASSWFARATSSSPASCADLRERCSVEKLSTRP
jgi:hypothetical protein